MFTISPTLVQQCIDMVAKGQDYIPSPDGLEEDYQEIVLPAKGAVKTFYVVYTPISGGLLQLCGEDYCSREEADVTYTACGEHIPVVICSYIYGGVMHEVKRNYQ